MIVKVGSPTAKVVMYTDDKKYQIVGDIGDPDSDILSISTQKDITSSAGTFTIMLVPRGDSKGKTWFDKLDAYDYVEIYLQGITDPGDIRCSNLKDNFIMRGLIDSVQKSESYEGGKPQRSITINGRDFGGLLTDIKEYFTPELDPEGTFVKRLFPLGALALRNMIPIKCTADSAFSYIMTAFKQATKMRLGLGSNVTIDLGDLIKGAAQSMYPNEEASIWFLNSFEDTYWNAFSKFEDNPFHELFIYDSLEYSWLILRPSRLKDALGNYSSQVKEIMQSGVELDATQSILTGTGHIDGSVFYQKDISIDAGDKISLTLEKSVDEVWNYFFTYPEISYISKINPRGIFLSPNRATPEASENPFFQTDENLPAYVGKFGFRQKQVPTVFVDLDPGEESSRGKSYEAGVVIPRFMQQGIEKNRTLIAWYLHNQYLLRGNMNIRGSSLAKIGTYLIDDDESMEYYIEGVNHNFVQFGSYTTSLRITRGMPKGGLKVKTAYTFNKSSVYAPVTFPKKSGTVEVYGISRFGSSGRK